MAWDNCIFREEYTMEIKGINSVINTYKSQRNSAPKKASAAAAEKRTDKAVFGFDTVLSAEKNRIAQAVQADATPAELAEARQTAEEGISAAELASYILMG